MLHGGPGLSETALFRHYNAALEQDFTVVYWDQRGAGKSYSRAIVPATMTLEQFITDLDDLVNALRVKLGHRKVVLFGHSWGAALGGLYASRYPDKVAAYVGCGQIGDWPAGEASSYAFAVAQAERMGNEKVLAKLRGIGPPPYSSKAVFTERTCLSRLEGQMTLPTLLEMARIACEGPERSVVDLPNLVRGFVWSMKAMWPEVSRLNLLQLAPVLQVPVFFFLGRRDHWVPAETSVAYFDTLTAPSKRLLWFEESGHEAFVDEPEKFNRAMIELVRPVVDAAAGSRGSPVGIGIDRLAQQGTAV
jgi:pimeloyl-ACP methyl ester carboxylesterase